MSPGLIQFRKRFWLELITGFDDISGGGGVVYKIDFVKKLLTGDDLEVLMRDIL